jgi:hypothetical protein
VVISWRSLVGFMSQRIAEKQRWRKHFLRDENHHGTPIWFHEVMVITNANICLVSGGIPSRLVAGRLRCMYCDDAAGLPVVTL